MDDTYRFLRQVEHRLQILFDRQTHEMPRTLEELRTLAIRMGYDPSPVRAKTGPCPRTASWPTIAARPRSTGGSSTTFFTTRFWTTTARRPTPWSTWSSTRNPTEEQIDRGAVALSVSRPAHGLSQPDGPGPRGLSLPVAGPLPPLPGGHRPQAAPGGGDRPPTRT